MRSMVKVLPGVVSAIVLAACGSAGSTSAGKADGSAIAADSTASGATDATSATDTGGPITAAVEEQALTVVAQVTDQGKKVPAALSGVIEHPIACTATAKCPLVVVVGDRDSNAFPTYKSGAKALAANAGVIVVIFNLPGTGEGGNKSGGTDDIGGNWHVTAVKDVMHLLAYRSDVDEMRTGYITIGTGLIPVAAAISKFGNSDLNKLRFLIDVEGPMDRCAISEAPEDDAHLIGPSDGPGATESACHFSVSPHEVQYPPAKDGNPASIVCTEGAWPISATGNNCQDNTWWIEREPIVNLKSMTASMRYWRLQFQNDHRLPSHSSSRLAMKAIGNSLVKWSALNWLAPCGAVPAEADCPAAGCWLEGGYGNGLTPAPYAAGKLKAISPDALLGQVLPEHVTTILDTAGTKDCK